MGKKKDKKPKKTVVFDESDRVDFITGEFILRSSYQLIYKF